MRSKFFWKLFLGNVSLLILVVAACVWLTFGAFVEFQDQELTRQLKALAEIFRRQVAADFDLRHAAELQERALAVADDTGHTIRLTLVDAAGNVLADTESSPAAMENHAGREEIVEALARGVGISTRWSHTLNRDLKYVAIRVDGPEGPRGVVRAAMPARTIAERAEEVRRLFWTMAGVVLLAAVILALGLAHLWSGPVARITATARSLSTGDLSAEARTHGRDEIALLARSLNQMRDHLAAQLRTIDRQRRTLERLLEQLHEGVVVAGSDGRLILINPAARRILAMLGVRVDNGRDWVGFSLQDRLPDSELRELLAPQRPGSDSFRLAAGDPALNAASSSSDEAGPSDSARHPAAIGECRLTRPTPEGQVTILGRASNIVLPADVDELLGADPSSAERREASPTTGRLLVLTDVTELTRAVQVKADFVANASHELRTPLAAIRAAVETLASLNPATEAREVERLAGVIRRHSARLEAMVSDLLDLSRLESPSAKFERTPLPLDEIIQDLRERFLVAAEAKSLFLDMEVGQECRTVWGHRHLFRLILDNLVDNAIKFTDPGGRVAVNCRAESETLVLSVEDTGCGIPPADHARVFERFYQVQRSRSGPSRGTGLGLAIVRHAAQAMDGVIELQSTPGVGTRITIRFPKAVRPPVSG